MTCRCGSWRAARIGNRETGKRLVVASLTQHQMLLYNAIAEHWRRESGVEMMHGRQDERLARVDARR